VISPSQTQTYEPRGHWDRRVRELRRTNRKEEVAERIVKYWKRIWEMDETSLLREALKEQTIEKGEN
jgi:hypothetical protein